MRARPLFTLFLVLSGCAPEASVEAHLSACGLLCEGALGPAVTSRFYAPDACYRDCLASATCDEIRGALCGTSIDVLLRCDQRCAHHCPGGELIAQDAVCDGAPTCTDGSDEEGCPTWRCADGSTIAAAGRCDGVAQCSDGTDEVGCPTCVGRGGWPVRLAGTRCDGYEECMDGSDEVGCPSHTCADGRTIPLYEGRTARCDGWAQCWDGSDEAGCAGFDTGACSGT